MLKAISIVKRGQSGAAKGKFWRAVRSRVKKPGKLKSGAIGRLTAFFVIFIALFGVLCGGRRLAYNIYVGIFLAKGLE